MLGDEVHRRLLGHLLAKFEARNGAAAAQPAPLDLTVAPATTLRVLPGVIDVHALAARASH